MRVFRLEPDTDSVREEALRAKQRRHIQQWRQELRPRAMRLFAARAAKLTWSRALLKLVVDELYPDDLFTELVGNLDRVPQRKWPAVIAVAVALRHSWRPDGLARIAKRLRISLATNTPPRDSSSPVHTPPTITSPIVRVASALSRLSASLRPR